MSAGKITIKNRDDSLWTCSSDGLSVTPSGTFAAETFKNLFTFDGSGDFVATTSFDMTLGFGKNISIDALTLSSGTATAKVTVSENTTANLIFAAYDITNTLVGVEYRANVTIEKGEKTYDSSSVFKTDGATKIKFMIWDNNENPLCKSKTTRHG